MSVNRLAKNICIKQAALAVLLLLCPLNCHLTKPERWNVVFILVDALRADHLGCYGYSKPTSPVIDALARRSALFESAYSNASWTKPSIPTLFTGLYPHQHQVFLGGKLGIAGQVTSDVLSSDFDTLAERMKAAGYDTAAFINNAQIRSFLGFNQGFDIYKEDLGDATLITETFLRWVRTKRQHPFFAYVHYLDTHLPYRPPAAFQELFPSKSGSVDFSGTDWHSTQDRIIAGTLKLSPEDTQNLTSLYDASIRFTDASIGQLLASLASLGLEEHTIVVFTADHGEEFLEHGGIGHGHTLYDEVLHVPLIIYYPKVKPERVTKQVQLLDVMPTILDLADKSVHLSGRSLTPFLTSRKSEDEVSFAEHRSSRWLESIRKGHYKLVRTFIFPGYRKHSDIPEIDKGMWLKVKGVPKGSGEFSASKIELLQPLDNIVLRGTLSETDIKGQKFKLLGIPCRITSHTAFMTEDRVNIEKSALADGLWFRVKGAYKHNHEVVVKEASKIQNPSNYDPEIKAPVISVIGKRLDLSIGMLSTSVKIDSSTKFAGAWPGMQEQIQNDDSPWHKSSVDPFRIRVLQSVELYDLRTDSHELRNIARENTALVKDLSHQLDLWEKQFPGAKKNVQEKALDEETVQRLRALGYVH